MKHWLGIALAVGLSTQAKAAAEWNPYASPSDEFGQHLQSAAFGEPGADRVLEDWLAAHPELAPDRRLQGYHQLCIDYDLLTWNRLRSTACAQYALLQKAAGTADSGDDNEAMAIAFADQPPIRAIGSAKVPLVWNSFGSQSTDVMVNGVTSPWFVDTGAQITVLTQSLADRMGVRRIGSGVRVGTTTSDVTGKVGIIDRLEIGSASVENVPVLILPDAQLKIGGVHQIDGILGFPVMVAFGRVAWVDGGRDLALGEAAPKARVDAPRIYWDDEGMGVPVRTSRGLRGAFLDTGANVTNWRSAGVPLLDPALVAAAREKVTHVGGAGGVVEIKQRQLSNLGFDLGPARVEVKDTSLAASDKASAAQVGMDAVSQFGTFILDFEQMRIDGRLKSAAERKATHQPAINPEDVKGDSGKDKRDGTRR